MRVLPALRRGYEVRDEHYKEEHQGIPLHQLFVPPLCPTCPHKPGVVNWKLNMIAHCDRAHDGVVAASTKKKLRQLRQSAAGSRSLAGTEAQFLASKSRPHSHPYFGLGGMDLPLATMMVHRCRPPDSLLSHQRGGGPCWAKAYNLRWQIRILSIFSEGNAGQGNEVSVGCDAGLRGGARARFAQRAACFAQPIHHKAASPGVLDREQGSRATAAAAAAAAAAGPGIRAAAHDGGSL